MNLLMNLLVAMPRETKTSLFTSHVTQGLFMAVCLIGLVFILLIFFQNYKDWQSRKNKVYEDEETQKTAVKSANRDFINSFLISLIVAALFIFLIADVGISVFL